MFRTIPSARLPCCTIFSRLPRNVSVISPISVRSLPSRDAPRSASCNSLVNSAENRGEIVDEIKRVLDLVRDPRRELAERCHLFGLD